MKTKCPSGALTTPHHDYVHQMPQTSLCSLPNEQVNHMSISVADCNVLSLPKITLEAMWDKANEYL